MTKISPGWTLIKIYTILVYIFMFTPIVVVIVLAFNPKQFGIFPMEGVSFRWFIKLAQNESIIDAFKNSLILGSLTTVISTGIGILAALAFIRFEFPGKNTINTLLLSPITWGRPERARRVMSLVRQSRGGRDNDARFHRRMSGQGVFADLIARRFAKACRDLSLADRRGSALAVHLFGLPAVANPQLSLL